MPLLLLVDGSSYLYRAFHALPDLRNASGAPTGAIYGVLNMLRRLREETAPDYSACIFDAKGKTFRDDWYADYKAHRPPMPADLVEQLAPLKACVEALGWPVLEVTGVEADDVIATLARAAKQRGLETLISTGDKDLAQLVQDGVRLMNTMSNEVLDQDGVVAKFGVAPQHIVDYLALIGDAVDNVPGVPKVGPKTAVKWLQQFGSLDGVIEHAADIGGAIGDNLRASLDWLPQARRLLTVKYDVELPLGLDDLGWRETRREFLAEEFRRLEFRSWAREFATAQGHGDAPANSGDTPKRAADLGRYETILDSARLQSWIDALHAAPIICVDTETTSLDPLRAELVGIALAVDPGQAAYIPLGHRYAGAPAQLDRDTALAALRPLLQDPTKPKLGQNLKYDTHIFANHGVDLAGLHDDTLLQSYVLESHLSHNMDALAERHLGLRTIKYEEVAGKGASQLGFDQVPIESAARYSAEDADVTLRLHRHLLPKIEADEKLTRVYRDIEMPLVEVLVRIERNGVLIDSANLSAQSAAIAQQLLDLEQRAHAAAGQPFNLNSTKQIQEILFDRLQLPVQKKTPGGKPSTDEDVLEKLALDYPLPRILLDYRSLAKLKSTYTDKLPLAVNPRTGRVHTNYAQAVANTGRLSSNDPNLQNIPVRTAAGRKIREAFIAPPGWHIVSADYSQIELRIMAHLSRDEGLLAAFAAGQDIHRGTAAEIFSISPETLSNEQRRYAKAINFGLIYGMSAFGLAQQLGIDRAAAQAYMDRYFARYPGVLHYMQQTRLTARALGYVETVFGRRLWFNNINSNNAMHRQGAERAAINAPMQGSAADLIKLAMIAVHRWLEQSGMASKLIMQVHDELVFEVPSIELDEVRRRVPELMTGVAQLGVPLVVDVGVGDNWDQAH